MYSKVNSILQTQPFDHQHEFHVTAVKAPLNNRHHREALLKKHFVRDCPPELKRQSAFTFHEDGFYKTLKRKALPILREAGAGPTRKMLFIQGGISMTVNIFGYIARTIFVPFSLKFKHAPIRFNLWAIINTIDIELPPCRILWWYFITCYLSPQS